MGRRVVDQNDGVLLCHFQIGVPDKLGWLSSHSRSHRRRQLCCVIFFDNIIDLRTSPGDIWRRRIMAEDLPVKKIKCSFEEVAVFADHPQKIKLDDDF